MLGGGSWSQLQGNKLRWKIGNHNIWVWRVERSAGRKIRLHVHIAELIIPVIKTGGVTPLYKARIPSFRTVGTRGHQILAWGLGSYYHAPPHLLYPPIVPPPPLEENFIWRRSHRRKFWPVFQRNIFGPPGCSPPPVVPPPGFPAKRGGTTGGGHGTLIELIF